MELKNIVREFLDAETADILINSITDGLINDTFAVEILSSKKKYIFQKINRNVFRNSEAIVDNHLTVNRLLSQNNYSGKIINPVPTRNGNYLDYHEGCWRMTEFLPESFSYLKVPDKETAYQSAKLFSEFYFSINQENNAEIKEVLPDFINFTKRIDDYKTALAKAEKHLIQNAETEIGFVNSNINLPEKWIAMQEQNLLPKRIIHADPKISNLLFSKDGKPLAVIDLDTVMVSTLLYDFGDMVRSYTNKTDEDTDTDQNIFDEEIYREVKKGFLFHLKDLLTPSEADNLDYAAQVVIYIQALRFLTDYLNGSIYYKITHPDHNLHRTRNQIALLKGLQGMLNKSL